jgi:translocation and assembly module TamA
MLNSRAPYCLTDVRAIVAVMVFVLATPAAAQDLRYRLEIDAPRDMARVLREGLSLARWQSDSQITAEQLRRLAQEAVREAREVAATEGYFSAKVDLDIRETQPEWTIALKLEPGPRTRISHVELRFSGPAERDPEAREHFERVRDAWSLRRGEPFRQADWDAAKREAVRELASWRYAAARIADSRAEIDPQSREARLMVELASGPAFRFGPLRITGMRRFRDALAENLSPIREGDTYERDKVLLYQRRLLETNYFASVQAEIDTDPLLADAAPLRVAVIESSTQHFEAGVGYSTDSGPRVEARYSNQDIYESAWRFKTGLRVDEQAQQLQVDFDSPPRPDRRSFRRTDDYILPRAGYLGTVEVGGSPWKLASQQFLRVTAAASLLYPIGRQGDFLLRAQAGSVIAENREGVPTTFLFRTGGDQTVRGYAFESLGVQQGSAIVGGRRLLVAGAEYTHWIGENWGLAGFVDAGDAWDKGLDYNPAIGYGVGGRFRTPIGPIRGDLAYGERTNQFRIHFSVGYTF